METLMSWQNTPILIAHRALLKGPNPEKENTLKAFEELNASQISALETDVLENGLITHDPPNPGETKPKLEEILPYAKTKLINLELKTRSNGNFKSVFDSIKTQDPLIKSHLLFSSFNKDALIQAKNHCPEIERAFLVRDEDLNIIKTAQELGIATINLSNKLASPERLKRLIPEFKVMVYTVNSQDRINTLISQGVSGIFTDYAADLKV